MWKFIQSVFSSVMGWIRPMWRSVAAFALVAALGLLSMGFLGLGLYYPAAPVLLLKFPPLNAWRGDWVWPTIIMVGMFFSVGFLLAGRINLLLESRKVSPWVRRAVYTVILWSWNLAVWFIVLPGHFHK